MDRQELHAKVDAVKAKARAENSQTRAALQIILAALNNGQRKKLARDPEVAAVLERYGVEVDA